VIMLVQMVQPGFVVNSVRHLQKEYKVLGAKIQFPVWTPEEKAAFGGQLALGIFPGVTASFDFAGRDADQNRPLFRRAPPNHDFAGLEAGSPHLRHGYVARAAELADGFSWLRTNGDDGSHGCQNSRGDLVRMNGDEQGAVELLR